MAARSDEAIANVLRGALDQMLENIENPRLAAPMPEPGEPQKEA